ncbi:MAG TPA: MFS transporter [Acidimicrobiia bacterium]|nr:MFS transporter [Acidimicrobiia bacterium]
MSGPAGDGARHSFVVLRHRDYALFWSAALVSNSGSWMQMIAAPYVIFQITHSTTWLGIGAFMAFFPAFCMGPLAGSLADRFPRKTVLLCTQLGMMFAAFGLFAAWELGIATRGVIIGLLGLAGIASGLNITAWQSFVPQLVPRADLLHAVRVNSMQFVAGRAFGPALAGVVLDHFGPGTAFLINALSFVFVLSALAAIHPRPVASDMQAGRVRDHFREAISYVRARQAILLPVITITMVSLLGSSVVQLAPAFAQDEFDVGRSAYGFLVSAFGIGAVLGSIIVALWADRSPRSRVATFGLLLFAGGEMLFGGAPGYGFGVVGMFLMGMAYVLIATAINTSIQARVDETHRGRAMSIYLMGLLAGVPIGSLLQGTIASVIGLRVTVLGSAALLLLWMTTAISRYDRLHPLDEALEDETGRGPDLVIGSPPSIASAD